MNRTLIITIILLTISSITGNRRSNCFAGAGKMDNAITMRIWPEKALGENAGVETERNEPSRGDGVIRVSNITDPTIIVFKAKQAQEKTPSVIICPGGGYNYLSFNKEGTVIADWLNSLGITAVVLKYRAPNQRENAFKDIQRALRVVRHNTEEFGIDPNQIGVMGFSAGAHLSARLSGDFKNKSYEQVDEKDALSCRPDFTILLYPAYLVDRQNSLQPDIKISPENPRTFIIQTQDDSIGVENSIYYYAALKKAGVQSELHLFPTGGHGYGMNPGENHAVSQWPKLCEQWLRQTGIIEKKTAP
ncbi:MAG: alpha/beta hydrolase [Sedimentisphaerales bacterium]|nr:alpha/beta hydrolase [Sedimentisphaerales bacterium]